MEEKDNIDKLIESASRLKVPEGRSKEEAWNILQQKIEAEKPRTKTVKFQPYISIGIAAALALVVVYFFLLGDSTFSSPRGEHRSLTLPDASAISLNAESEVQYNARSWKEKRTVKMKGEAFFDVTPGSSFVVETVFGNVEVMGTNFNVRQRESSFEVGCFSGSVRVKDNYGNVVTLKAQEFTSLIDNKLLPATQASEKMASWRTGEFHFENAPFMSVVKELERQFNVEIEMKPAPGRNYTGYFTTKNLEESLRLVFTPMGLTYKISGKKIIVD